MSFDFENTEYFNQGGNSFYGVKLSYPETAKRELDPDAFQNQFSLHLYDREHFSSDRAVYCLIYKVYMSIIYSYNMEWWTFKPIRTLKLI